MIILYGYSRFPIIYSSDGQKTLPSNASDLIYRPVSRSVIIFSMKNIRMKRRFVLRSRSLNVENGREETVPRKIYVQNDSIGSEPPVSGSCLGFVLKGTRQSIFVPLIQLHDIDVKEAELLFGMKNLRRIDERSDLNCIMEKLSIRYDSKQFTDSIGITITDTSVNPSRYQVKIDNNGRVIETNVCVDFEELYLVELIFLLRSRGHLHVFPQIF